MTQNVYDFSELTELAQTTATDCMTQALGCSSKEKLKTIKNNLTPQNILREIGNEDYTPNKCPDWIHNICESLIDKVIYNSNYFQYL